MAPTPLASIRSLLDRLHTPKQKAVPNRDHRVIAVGVRDQRAPSGLSPLAAPSLTLSANAAITRDSPSHGASIPHARIGAAHSSQVECVRKSAPPRDKLSRDDSVLHVQRMWLLRLEQEHDPAAALLNALAVRRAEASLAAQRSKEHWLQRERDEARARLWRLEAQLWAESAVLTGMEARHRTRVSC